MAQRNLVSALYSIGHSQSCVASGEFLMHAHPFYELYYIRSGNVDYMLSGVEYKLKPGTLLVIQPNEFHGVRVNTEEVYERYTLHFVTDLLSYEKRELLQSALALEQEERAMRCLEDSAEYRLLDGFLTIDQLFDLSEELQMQLVPTLVEAILVRILLMKLSLPNRCAIPNGEEPHARPNEMIQPVLSYLNSHFMDRITLDMLAEKFYISKSHLNLCFHKATGTTVIDYLRLKRVTYAQQLLINGIPAAQAGIAAGFSDYTSFYRAYVKHFGCSPNQDRRRA